MAEVLPQMEALFLDIHPEGTVFGVGSFFPEQFYHQLFHSYLRDFWVRLPLWRRLDLALFPRRRQLLYRRYLEWICWNEKCYGHRYYLDYHWYGEHPLVGGPLPLILLNPAIADQPVFPMVPYYRFNLPAGVMAVVDQWKLPEDTVFLFVTPPEEVMVTTSVKSHIHRAIRCAQTGGLGTACVPLTGNHAAFLTVGHMFPNGHNSLVEVVRHRWPQWFRSPQYQQVGRVIKHITPRGSRRPEYDAAIVMMDVISHLPELAHSGVAVTPPHYEQPVLGTIYGGVSGVVRDTGIVGALKAYGSPNVLWKNSWLLVPSGSIVRGDSGGAFVLDYGNKVAGMVVGGSRVGSSNRFMVQYIQDMASIQKDFLCPAGFSVT